MGEPARGSAPPESPALVADRFLAAHFEDILASLGDGLLITDLEGCVVYMSPGAEDLTTVSGAHARGRPVAQAFAAHPWLVETVTSLLGQAQRARATGELILPFGRRVPVQLTSTSVVDAGGTVVGSAVLFRDLVTKRTLGEPAQRGTRVGELAAVAAGLAHEIKNPLGGIKGAAQILAETLAGDAEGVRFTSLITREVDRVSGLLEQLLELTRPPRLRLAAVNVHRVLQDVLALEDAATGDAPTVRCHFDPSLPEVWADEAQLRQVFLNLVKNALEAMGGGGTLTVTTRMDADLRVRGPGDRRGHRFLCVDVEDTGRGIPPEDWDRIFTPFFTTKTSGTGLGLAVSQRLVAQHGGRIRVESEPGRGTRVRVSLPVAVHEGKV